MTSLDWNVLNTQRLWHDVSDFLKVLSDIRICDALNEVWYLWRHLSDLWCIVIGVVSTCIMSSHDLPTQPVSFESHLSLYLWSSIMYAHEDRTWLNNNQVQDIPYPFIWLFTRCWLTLFHSSILLPYFVVSAILFELCPIMITFFWKHASQSRGWYWCCQCQDIVHNYFHVATKHMLQINLNTHHYNALFMNRLRVHVQAYDVYMYSVV